MKAKIYLLPITLGESELQTVIPDNIFEIIKSLKYFIVENIRTTRRFLKKIDKSINIDELVFFELNKHTDKNAISEYLKPALEGHNIGLMSEAGNPGIADPGSDIVKIAHRKSIQVVPLVGPSSILLALISSGMNGQNFAFNGYLPVKSTEKSKKILFLEKKSRQENQTQIFMEAPYRNQNMLSEILKICNKNTRLCIAVDITLEAEFIKTKTIAEWKKNIPQINKRPAIFIIHG